MTPAARRAELAVRIVDQLTISIPNADKRIVQAAVTESAKAVPSLTALWQHLSAFPDALTTGRAEVPLALVRLAHEVKDPMPLTARSSQAPVTDRTDWIRAG